MRVPAGASGSRSRSRPTRFWPKSARYPPSTGQTDWAGTSRMARTGSSSWATSGDPSSGAARTGIQPWPPLAGWAPAGGGPALVVGLPHQQVGRADLAGPLGPGLVGGHHHRAAVRAGDVDLSQQLRVAAVVLGGAAGVEADVA